MSIAYFVCSFEILHWLQHFFGHISVVGPPNQLSWTTNQWSPIYSTSDQLLIPHDIWISSERQMTTKINCLSEIMPHLRIKPATCGMVTWLTHLTSNLRIVSGMGSNPVRDKSLFPWAWNFTLIAQYWLVPGTDSRVFL